MRVAFLGSAFLKLAPMPPTPPGQFRSGTPESVGREGQGVLKESGGAHRPQQAVADGLPRSPSKPLAPPGQRILSYQSETGREGLGEGTILPAIPSED